ncbi:MAG: HAD hydrolase family protein [Aquificae bacterium]|nr:HAD hydrolase family protein [Aquificota bacterium]
MLRDRARRVKLLVSDADGVLTDGTLYYGPEGERLKAFSVLDGVGVSLIKSLGIELVVVSGRSSPALKKRLEELGLPYELGVKDKLKKAEELLAARGLSFESLAALGDDLPDLPLLKRAGFALAVRNAVPEVKKVAHYVTRLEGGKGALREVAELLRVLLAT